MARGACHENVGEKPRLNIMAAIYINLEFRTIFDEKRLQTVSISLSRVTIMQLS
jgi:hypothetical protein